MWNCCSALEFVFNETKISKQNEVVAGVEDGSLDESQVNLTFAETDEGTTQTKVNPAMSSQQNTSGTLAI